MRYSRIFGKTSKTPVKDSKFKGHELLVKAGFIAESSAGRYYFLPLGWRVHDKIKTVIKEEMDAAGAQEMITPTLHPLELWQETNRTNTVGFELMIVKDRRGAQFALGGTAEEMFVDLVRKFQISYKDLPFNLYQFSNKFRDELRARGGLLRVREFIMKDAYSFDKSAVEFKRTYNLMAETYHKIFRRLGLTAIQVEADNGYIGGEYCHEFQIEHPQGEGTFFVSPTGSYCAHQDVAKFKLEVINPEEKIQPMKIVDQPEWVHTIEDNLKHYGKDKKYFLKNVVYRTKNGDIIIVTIRGDLEVNKAKLEKLLNLTGQIEDASPEDLALLGTKPGYVHSWGHQFINPVKTADGKSDCHVIYIADVSLKSVRNFIGGQKEETTDSINVNYGRDFKHEIEADVAMAQDGMMAPDGSGPLQQKNGIEVGNIFQLGTHYTDKMKGADYIDEKGKRNPFYMGSYGIGLGRTMAAIAEIFHDDRGLRWPTIIAPFQVHLISLKGGEEKAEAYYHKLLNDGVEVVWDDRPISAGEKFAIADLIGCPIRLVISAKTGDQIEFKRRDQDSSQLLSADEVSAQILEN